MGTVGVSSRTPNIEARKTWPVSFKLQPLYSRTDRHLPFG
jgi:hypothetical protein